MEVLRNEGEERKIAEGGITEIQGSHKIILQLQYNCTNSSEKRNTTDFGIISYKYRSVNCNEKRGGGKKIEEGRTYGSRWKIKGEGER